MEHPEHQHPHSGHEHHQANRMDRPSPANMLWSFLFIIIIFLFVLILTVAIWWLKKEFDEPEQPPIENPEVVPPTMLPSDTPSVWSPDAPEATLTFVSDADINDFISVTIQGIEIDRQYYDLSAGSTIVTLHANFLKTLTVGIYRIGIHSENGVAEATFEIKTATEVGPPPPADPSYLMKTDESTVLLPEIDTIAGVPGIHSDYAILVDLSTNTIVAQRKESARIYPASMTKVMTLLVACEMLTDAQLNEYLTMSAEVVTAMEQAGAGGAKLEAGEELRVYDLLAAIAMESDAVAAIEVARYLCGSEEAFVQKMNEKCAELGLINTHFVNVTGLDHDEQYSTCREIASIMAAAMDNVRVKNLLSTKVPHELKTNKYEKRTFYSTYYKDTVDEAGKFDISARPTSGMVLAAKTGYEIKAGFCLVTYFQSNSGKEYIVVTANADLRWFTVKDYKYIYETYAQ